MARGHVRNQPRHHEGGDAAHVALQKRRHGLLERLDPADPGADDDPHPLGTRERPLETSFVEGELGRGEPILREGIGAALLFALEETVGLGPHLPATRDGAPPCRSGLWTDAGPALRQRRPVLGTAPSGVRGTGATTRRRAGGSMGKTG
jgi:hypothetical protein